MKKRLVALCLSAGLLAGLPAVSFADVNIVAEYRRGTIHSGR